MILDKIITLANRNVRIKFNAMERSLRAVGCNLPIWVIPYDENKFDLPKNSIWWEIPEIIQYVGEMRCKPVMRKYQCLLTQNYHFVDSDVVFLRNPEKVLKDLDGFVTSCCHWHDSEHTTTIESILFFISQTTTWQMNTFNTGQFACSEALYTFDNFKATAEKSQFCNTVLSKTIHEQPGINLLVNYSGINISNLTLPPLKMESTWAGDYNDDNYEGYWKNEDRKPYLLHWAGCDLNSVRPIDKIFLQYLNKNERLEWDRNNCKSKQKYGLWKRRLGLIYNSTKESIIKICREW